MADSSTPRISAPASRFVVGIDLGTTNTSVSYVDIDESMELVQFPIEQLVRAGEIGTHSLLPSFCYLPGTHELPEGATELPWNPNMDHVVGIFAREQGAAIPGRLVASAKSWLAHAGVDRTRGILPWGSSLGDQMVSPVAVSAAYLSHIRNAWDHRFGTLKDREGTPCLLAEQQIILTVPASFDEAARELTLEAAREAGLTNISLLEEPLAAFYAWLARNEGVWQKKLNENDTVAVVDVGGGTTDLSLVHIEPGYTLRRTDVGEHLLLGGDNMDMALARDAEAAWGERLGSQDWAMLCHQCRNAKELILSPEPPEYVDIGMAGRSSAIVAATRTHRFPADKTREMLLEGFFPPLDPDASPPQKRRGIREMGLPYAADAAITRHLLHFLKNAGRHANGEDLPLIPSCVLFNGGGFVPQCFRERILGLLGTWAGNDAPLPELPADDLNLSVSRGAAYYGLVRRGMGVKVKGGTARAYYLEVGAAGGTELVCVMPRDIDEGIVQELHDPVFRLRANRPVAFPIYTSATRLGDFLGDLVSAREEISSLPPLKTVLKYGGNADREVPVTLASKLTEVGTLEVSCHTADRSHIYPLQFDLRATGETEEAGPIEQTVEEALIKNAMESIETAFQDVDFLKNLTKTLEETLEMPRKDWAGSLSRLLADVLIKAPGLRLPTARHEARWLNLVGFLARPGFGAPADEWRVRELWKLWHAGPQHPNDAQTAAEWWILWRRIAGGLRSGHQQQIASILTKMLLTKPGEKLGPRKKAVQEATEMWRCLGAMERISVKAKRKILATLLNEQRRLEPHHFWVIARVAARCLFHGPQDCIVPAQDAEPLLPKLIQAAEKARFPRPALLALLSISRPCNIRGLDLAPTSRDKVRTVLRARQTPSTWLKILDGTSQEDADLRNEIIGEELPLGLMIT